MADFKLSTERFDEIKTLISENPTKAEKSIKKAELLDFISDSTEKIKADCRKDAIKVKAELKRQEEYLVEANKKNEKLHEKINELEIQTVADRGQASLTQTKYESLLKKLNAYRFVCIVLAIVVLLQIIL